MSLFGWFLFDLAAVFLLLPVFEWCWNYLRAPKRIAAKARKL